MPTNAVPNWALQTWGASNTLLQPGTIINLAPASPIPPAPVYALDDEPFAKYNEQVPYTLKSSVADALVRRGVGSRLCDGAVGIELEAEGSVDNPGFMFWKAEADGSLRNNGIEYILKRPLSLPDLKSALTEFEEKTKHCKFAVSPRTSCHVHVNVQKFTFQELYAVVGAYWLFEPILLEHCGPSRISNLFCLQASDASHIVSDVIYSIKRAYEYPENAFLMEFNNDEHKYAALNLASLPRFGSIEFRSMRGIYKKKEIYDWADLLYTFVHRVREIGTVTTVYQIFKESTLSNFVDLLFGPYADLIRSFPNWQDSIKKNSLFLAQLSFFAARAEKGEFQQKKSVGRKVKVPSLNYATPTLALPSTYLLDDALSDDSVPVISSLEIGYITTDDY